MEMSLRGGKIRAFTALSYLAVAVLSGVAGAQQIQRIAAIVNDEVISAHDLEERLRLVLASAEVSDTTLNRRRLRVSVLRRLVDEKLQVQEGRRLNIRLTSEQIDRAIELLAKQNNTTVDGLETMLARRDIRLGSLLTRIRADLVWSTLLARRYAGTIQIGDDEIDEVIARLDADKGKPEHRISEILLTVNDPDEDEEVRRNAQRLAQEARGGARFEAIAQQFSQATTASLGGEVGWVRPGQVAAEIEAELQNLGVGEISEPIRAVGGYYVIKLHDRRSILAGGPSAATVSLKQMLFPRNPDAAPDEVERQSRRAAAIADTVQGCADFETAVRELGTPGSGDLGTVRVGDLPPEFRAAVAELAIGRASAPIKRQQAIHVLMVCERNDSGPQEPDREEIRFSLHQQRLALVARRYLRDLRRDAVIELR